MSDKKLSYDEALNILLEQINSRDIKMADLMEKLDKTKELSEIRIKEKDKKYKNTKIILLSLLFISIMTNIILLLK